MKKHHLLVFAMCTFCTLDAQTVNQEVLSVYTVICCNIPGTKDTTGFIAIADSAVVLDLDSQSDESIYFNRNVIVVQSVLLGNSIFLKEKGRKKVKIEFGSAQAKKDFIKNVRRLKVAKVRNYKWVEYPIFTLQAMIFILVVVSVFIK